VSSPSEATQIGRRIRAAFLLSDKAPEDVAPELNVSTRTLERVMAGTRQARDWELRRLSELLEVPEWFLREGLAAQPTPDKIREGELAELRRQLEDLDRKIDVAGFGQRLGVLEGLIRELLAEVRAFRGER
jgi:hypothetical protein